MAERFVIDINVGQQGREQGGQQGILGVSALAARNLRFGDLGTTRRGDERMSKEELAYMQNQGANLRRGSLQSPLSRTYTDEDMPGLHYGVETTFGYGTRKVQESVMANKRAIKGLGVATAYKGVSSAMEINAYTSGDQVANQRVQQTAKAAGYASAMAISGFNPVVIAGIVGMEAINAGVDAYKYNYDRKMERSQITNSEIVLGDISYGRRRGGR